MINGRKFDPEVIEKALFNLITTSTAVLDIGFKRMSRHARLWPNTPIQDQPALYLIPLGGRQSQQRQYGVPNRELHYVILVLSTASADPVQEDQEPPQSMLNKAWKAIDLAMTPLPGQQQTLNGIVTNAFIEGEIPLAPAVVDTSLRLEIPIIVVLGL